MGTSECTGSCPSGAKLELTEGQSPKLTKNCNCCHFEMKEVELKVKCGDDETEETKTWNVPSGCTCKECKGKKPRRGGKKGGKRGKGGRRNKEDNESEVSDN